MSKRLTIALNGESQLEYDRGKALAPGQLAYLDRMDDKMAQGIDLDGRFIADPDRLQRAQFVALQLVQAVKADNEMLAAATCSYLAVRIPELRQVRITDTGEQHSLDLVFDRDFAPEIKLNFVSPDTLKTTV